MGIDAQTLRWLLRRGKRGPSVQLVSKTLRGEIFGQAVHGPRNSRGEPAPVGVHGLLDGGMSHLLLDVGGGDPCGDETRAEGVTAGVQAEVGRQASDFETAPHRPQGALVDPLGILLGGGAEPVNDFETVAGRI